MKAAAILMASIISIGAQAGETDCLASIMYAESRGEPLEGVIAIGQAVINRSKAQAKPICRVSGVKRKKPPAAVSDYYRSIAKQLIAKPSNSVAKQADSWNTGTKPRQPGTVTRQIESHVFYILQAKAEQVTINRK